ncbi:hypothetical protein A616_16565 [Brevibacillus brevis X23]|nr:hypothetical protein A616_16565 [Brevibacillus brevis X23]
MSIGLEGFDEFRKQLKDMQKAAQELDGKHNIPLPDLLTDSFISENTSLSSLQELLDNSGFKIETTEDFEAIPDAEWDEYISSVSEFESWGDMLRSAAEEYALKKLGF